MNEISVILPVSKRTVIIKIERKKMKTCRLKVYPNGDVKIAVPQSTNNSWIENYLRDKSDWIEKKLAVFTKTTSHASTENIRNGMSIKLLGQDYIFSVSLSSKEKVYAENKLLHICCLNTTDADRIQTLFDKWWRKEASIYYQKVLDELFSIVGKYNVAKPKMLIKKMKTLWGSCNAARGIVYLNQFLFKAKPPCIEYVILHELVHLLYPNHSKSFYDFLGTYMPDWKDRKKMLDFDVVHGL